MEIKHINKKDKIMGVVQREEDQKGYLKLVDTISQMGENGSLRYHTDNQKFAVDRFAFAQQHPFLRDGRDGEQTRDTMRLAIIGNGFAGVATTTRIIKALNTEQGHTGNGFKSPAIEIVLIDSTQGPGGFAYKQAAQKDKKLNLPRTDIPTLANSPSYAEWAEDNTDNHGMCLDDAVYRENLGGYLGACIAESNKLVTQGRLQSGVQVTFQKVAGRVTDISKRPSGDLTVTAKSIKDADEKAILEEGFDHVVLATGYGQAKRPAFITDSVAQSPQYLESPYGNSKPTKDFYKSLDDKSHVLIIGTGLTGYDSALSVIEHGATATCVSRGGHQHEIYSVGRKNIRQPNNTLVEEIAYEINNLSQNFFNKSLSIIELEFTKLWDNFENDGHTPDQILAALELAIPRIIKKAQEQDKINEEERHAPQQPPQQTDPSRSASEIEAIDEYTGGIDIGQTLPQVKPTPPTESAVKLLLELWRKHSSYITTARVGVVAAIGQLINDAKEDKKLNFVAAGKDNLLGVGINETGGFSVALYNQEDYEEDGVLVGPDGENLSKVTHIINATGQELDVNKIDDPLIRNLLKKGFIRAHAIESGDSEKTRYETGLGIDVAPTGNVIGHDGKINKGISAAGAIMSGAIAVGDYPHLEKTEVAQHYREGGRLGAFSLNLPGIFSAVQTQTAVSALNSGIESYEDYLRNRVASTVGYPAVRAFSRFGL